MEDMIYRLDRVRLVTLLYRLSEMNISTGYITRSPLSNPLKQYNTREDIIFEPSLNSSPQNIYYDTTTSTLKFIQSTLPVTKRNVHPFLTLPKLTALLRSDMVQEEYVDIIQEFFNRTAGYGIVLHKSIKFDGVVQGMAVTYIYASQVEGGRKDESRFDWVEFISEDNDLYPSTFGQVCAILELQSPNQRCGQFMIVTARASRIEKRGLQGLNPFMTIQYDSNAFNLDPLDDINRPAYVLPLSTLRSHALLVDERLRRDVMFTAIPYAFFNRDDWDNLSVGLTWTETEVAKGETKRLVPYQCSESRRSKVIKLCSRSMLQDPPDPEGDTLISYFRKQYLHNNNIFEDIISGRVIVLPAPVVDRDQEEEDEQEDEQEEQKDDDDDGGGSSDDDDDEDEEAEEGRFNNRIDEGVDVAELERLERLK
jgi:hypothetical protein